MASPFRVLFWVIVLGCPPALAGALGQRASLTHPDIHSSCAWCSVSELEAQGCARTGGSLPAALPAAVSTLPVGVEPACRAPGCVARLLLGRHWGSLTGHCGHGNNPTNRERWVQRAFLCPFTRAEPATRLSVPCPWGVCVIVQFSSSRGMCCDVTGGSVMDVKPTPQCLALACIPCSLCSCEASGCLLSGCLRPPGTQAA